MIIIYNTFCIKNVVFFYKNEVTFPYVGGATSIAFPLAETDEEGFTAIGNKNQL